MNFAPPQNNTFLRAPSSQMQIGSPAFLLLFRWEKSAVRVRGIYGMLLLMIPFFTTFFLKKGASPRKSFVSEMYDPRRRIAVIVICRDLS